MKRIVAALATFVMLAGAIYLGRNAGPRHDNGREQTVTNQSTEDEAVAPPNGSRSTGTPQQCVEEMFTAAKNGDVESYVECFTGAERKQIERELARQPRELYAQALADALLPLKGRAIVSQPVSDDAQRSQITVERVYANHNELQTFRLCVESGRWRIYEIGDARTQQPPISYGTPVVDPLVD